MDTTTLTRRTKASSPPQSPSIIPLPTLRLVAILCLPALLPRRPPSRLGLDVPSLLPALECCLLKLRLRLVASLLRLLILRLEPRLLGLLILALKPRLLGLLVARLLGL